MGPGVPLEPLSLFPLFLFLCASAPESRSVGTREMGVLSHGSPATKRKESQKLENDSITRQRSDHERTLNAVSLTRATLPTLFFFHSALFAYKDQKLLHFYSFSSSLALKHSLDWISYCIKVYFAFLSHQSIEQDLTFLFHHIFFLPFSFVSSQPTPFFIFFIFIFNPIFISSS